MTFSYAISLGRNTKNASQRTFAATDVARTPTQNHESRGGVPNRRSILKREVKSPFSSRYVSSSSKVGNVSEDMIDFTREWVAKSAINFGDSGRAPLMSILER